MISLNNIINNINNIINNIISACQLMRPGMGCRLYQNIKIHHFNKLLLLLNYFITINYCTLDKCNLIILLLLELLYVIEVNVNWLVYICELHFMFISFWKCSSYTDWHLSKNLPADTVTWQRCKSLADSCLLWATCFINAQLSHVAD